MSAERLNSGAEISQVGYIESLVKEERIPRLIKMNSFGSDGKRKVEVMVVVPPVGLTGGNHWEVLEGGLFEVFDSNGEIVGRSKYYYISPESAEKIQEKINSLHPQEELKPGIAAKIKNFFKRT